MIETDYATYAEFKAWRPEDFATFSADEANFYAVEVGRAAGGAPCLFELGFGNGSLLGWARGNGYAVSGFEVQTGLMERAGAAGFAIDTDPARMEPASFDVIVALDVFEHIAFPDLAVLVPGLHRALKPGGRLIARFPNGDSPFSMPLFNGDHTHVTWLGAGKIAQLMRIGGFDSYDLRAPHEPQGTLRGSVKQAIKARLRRGYELFARMAYLGGSAPSTFCLNYMLVARKN